MSTRHRPIFHTALLGALLVGLAQPGFAQKLEENGVKIEVNRGESGAPGFSVFEVKAVNESTEARTLYAIIELSWKDEQKPDGPPRATSNCIAYLEIPAKHELKETVPCRGDKFSSYNVKVQGAYGFVLPQTPLTWQEGKPLPGFEKKPEEKKPADAKEAAENTPAEAAPAGESETKPTDR